MRKQLTTILRAALAVSASAGVAGAQLCEPRWSDEFEVGADDGVVALEADSCVLYAAGNFTSIGGVAAWRVAKYDNRGWGPLGAGFAEGGWLGSLLDVDLPFARGVVAGGTSAIGLWEDSAWRTLGPVGIVVACDPGPCSHTLALAVFDDGRGPALFATGSFGYPAPGIARWDGEWEGLGSGLISPLGVPGLYAGHSLAAHDDGSGPALYVGGYIQRAGGVEVRNIARWRSTGWTAVGGGLEMTISSLAEFEIDGRPQLIAGGRKGEVWRWDGAAWTRMGGLFSSGVSALAVFDDGTGSALYAGGFFTQYDGKTLRHLARWDGAGWVEAAGGVSGSVRALEVQPYDGVWSLVVGGSFSSVGAGVPSQNIARLIGCARVCYADCDGSGDLTFFDFVCFQELFAAMDPGADCDGDAAFTFFDFLCFQNAFVAGCE